MVLLVRPPRIALALGGGASGCCQGLGQFGFLFLALQVGMTAALASVLMQTQVFFTALFAFVLLQRAARPRRCSGRHGPGRAGPAVLCHGLSSAPAARRAADTTLAGLVLTLCAASPWAGSNIVARLVNPEAPGYDPLAFVVWSCLVPVLPFVALSAWLDPDAGRWLQWRGLGRACRCWAGWLGRLPRLGRHRASATACGRACSRATRPTAWRRSAWACPWSAWRPGLLVLGEVVTPWQWAGVACVVPALAGVVLGRPALGRRIKKTRSACALRVCAWQGGRGARRAFDQLKLPVAISWARPARRPSSRTAARLSAVAGWAACGAT